MPLTASAESYISILLKAIRDRAKEFSLRDRTPSTLDAHSMATIFGPFVDGTSGRYAGSGGITADATAKRSLAEMGTSLCVICMDKDAVRACVPCGHLCFCEDDAAVYIASRTLICPLCRIALDPTTPTIHVYKS